jgi:hypothetical protein
VFVFRGTLGISVSSFKKVLGRFSLRHVLYQNAGKGTYLTFGFILPAGFCNLRNFVHMKGFLICLKACFCWLEISNISGRIYKGAEKVN